MRFTPSSALPKTSGQVPTLTHFTEEEMKAQRQQMAGQRLTGPHVVGPSVLSPNSDQMARTTLPKRIQDFFLKQPLMGMVHKNTTSGPFSIGKVITSR